MRQSISVPYEVVVVDNGSTDRTPEIAAQFPCRIVQEPQIGQLRAKRAGVEAAEAQIIAILDADCVADPSWLASI